MRIKIYRSSEEADEAYLQESLILARKVWRDQARQVQGATEVLLSCEEDWLGFMFFQQDAWKVRQRIAEKFCKTDWSWPEYTRWRSLFQQFGGAPRVWYCVDGETGEALSKGVAALIIWTATNTFYTKRNISRWLPKGCWWTLTRAEDPVVAQIAEMHREDIEAGDYSVLPPFFPGDPTGLLPDSAAIRKAHAERGRPEPRR